MSEYLFQYHEIQPTTWVYLSSLLLIGLYFKFGRLWSVRNLDLLLLILLGPGLLMVHYGQSQQGELRAAAEDAAARGNVSSEQPNVSTSRSGQQTPASAGESAGDGASDAEPNDAGTAQDSGQPLGQPLGQGTDDDLPPSAEQEADAESEQDTSAAASNTDVAAANAERPNSGETGAVGAEPAEAAATAPVSPEIVSNAAVPLANTASALAMVQARGEPAELEVPLEQLKQFQSLELWGFSYLFMVSALTLVRLLLDPMMVRRPLLEPNLSQGGLLFICVALFVFLVGNVIAEPVAPVLSDAADYRIARVAPASTQGPGYALLGVLPSGLTKALSIVGQLLIAIGLTFVGYRHFRNLVMGVGAATLYLMLPYTTLLTGRVEHILPATTLVWAILMYRRPLISGILIGLASGLVYYPFFVLPLWLSFYWHRGFGRFLSAYLGTLLILALGLMIYSPNGLQTDLTRMFGIWAPAVTGLGGIWNTAAGGIDANYRLPVLVAFLALSISLALWPAQKNLGTLLSCTAAVMVACQFWHGYGGGTYMAWYLPLFLLTIFRPNLEDRVAIAVLGEPPASQNRRKVVSNAA